jgi:polyferredoxin
MLNKLFKNKYLLLLSQIITLIAFALIIYNAIGVTTNDTAFAKVLRNTNLSNLIVWSYWWPLIILTAILFGRFWCTVCPMELVTSLFGKIGFKRKPGKLLKSKWIITIFYAVILIIGIHTFTIHRVPQYMAIYMLSLFAIAVLVGVIWEKRSFCTYVCPIGHLLGLYSLLSFKKLRVKDPEVCVNCKTKDCISTKNHYKILGRSCTSELYPPKIADNRECLLCGQCFKSCTKDNISIQRQSIVTDVFKNIKLTSAEIFFFILVSGFVIYEVLSEWATTEEILMAIPNWTNETLALSGSITGTVKAILLFILLPLAYYLVFVLLKKAIAKESIKKSFTHLVLALLPIAASMHLFKALLKTTSRIPYWEYVFADPIGVETANLLINNPMLIAHPYLSTIEFALYILAIALLIGGFVLSITITKKQEHKNKSSRLLTNIAALIYFGTFMTTLLFWIL